MVVSHKRADREPDFGHAFLTSSVAVHPPVRWMRSGGVAGECPEWQRELTVNQPSYDFEGSSPSSPTIAFLVICFHSVFRANSRTSSLGEGIGVPVSGRESLSICSAASRFRSAA